MSLVQQSDLKRGDGRIIAIDTHEHNKKSLMWRTWTGSFRSKEDGSKRLVTGVRRQHEAPHTQSRHGLVRSVDIEIAWITLSFRGDPKVILFVAPLADEEGFLLRVIKALVTIHGMTRIYCL